MDTKQKQRSAPRTGTGKKATEAENARKTRKRPGAAASDERKAPAQRGRERSRQTEQTRAQAARQAEQARTQAARQAARQGANSLNQPRELRAENLPQEEIYRPEPNRDRHSQEHRREAPAQRRPGKPAKSRAYGRTAARRKNTASRTVRPPRKNTPAVIYTQPLPFNLNRLLIRLLTVAALVLAFTMALSIFFKVEVITVSGAKIYSEWDIREASGIDTGDSLLTFSRARAGAKIRAELPYVEQIRFGIKLPNTVIIDIEELDVAYAIQATDGLWWFVTSDGRIVEQTDEGTASSYTKIRGVTIEYPEVNATAVAWEQAVATQPEDTTAGSDGSDETTEAPVTVTNADRLDAALQIAQALEANAVVGQISEVNVSDLGAITMTYGTRYTVKMGGTEDLEMKVAAMRDAVAQMSDFQQGILDVSFKIWTDKVVFTPTDD